MPRTAKDRAAHISALAREGISDDGDPILELGPDEPGQVPAQDE